MAAPPLVTTSILTMLGVPGPLDLEMLSFSDGDMSERDLY